MKKTYSLTREEYINIDWVLEWYLDHSEILEEMGIDINQDLYFVLRDCLKKLPVEKEKETSTKLPNKWSDTKEQTLKDIDESVTLCQYRCNELLELSSDKDIDDELDRLMVELEDIKYMLGLIITKEDGE